MEYVEDLRWVEGGVTTAHRAEGDSPASLKLAKDLVNDICSHGKYGQNYMWRVRVIGGVVIVTEGSFERPQWGITRKLRASDFSASNLKKDVLMAAGEWLERGNLPRARVKYEFDSYRVEGVPEKDQPKIINA